uniref:Uncharacterized protein n=1 Tax=Musca domestica TaxID=7370 RepID=A0A1I8MG94_MUSDO
MEIHGENNENISRFTADCKARLAKLFARLNWTEEGVLKSFNTNSPAAKPKVTKDQSSNPFVSPKKATYPDSLITANSIILTTPKLQNLLKNPNVEAPQNFIELQRDFSRDEKLAIYEFTIENTRKINNNVIEDGPEGASSLADIVAEKKREAKRKKRKFRKTKPTLIEEIRALVLLQMQALEQFCGNKQSLEGDKQKESFEGQAKSMPFERRERNQGSSRQSKQTLCSEESKDRTRKNEHKSSYNKSRDGGTGHGRRDERDVIKREEDNHFSRDYEKRNDSKYSHGEENRSCHRYEPKKDNFGSNAKDSHRLRENDFYRQRSPHNNKDIDTNEKVPKDPDQRRGRYSHNEEHRSSSRAERHRRSRSRDNARSYGHRKEQHSRNRSRSPHHRREANDYYHRRSKSPETAKHYSKDRYKERR